MFLFLEPWLQSKKWMKFHCDVGGVVLVICIFASLINGTLRWCEQLHLSSAFGTLYICKVRREMFSSAPLFKYDGVTCSYIFLKYCLSVHKNAYLASSKNHFLIKLHKKITECSSNVYCLSFKNRFLGAIVKLICLHFLIVFKCVFQPWNVTFESSWTYEVMKLIKLLEK